MTLPTDVARSPRRRKLRWALAAIAVVLTALLLVVVVLLQSLERPWLKRRLQDAIRKSADLDVDWSDVRVHPLSGIEIARLFVHSPLATRHLAPELAEASAVEAHWTLGTLFGSETALTSIHIGELTVTVVKEAARVPTGPVDPSNQTPLSRLLAPHLAGAPPLAALDVDRLTVNVIAPTSSGTADHLRVSGLALSADAQPDRDGWRLSAQLGRNRAPRDITLVRSGGVPGNARARVSAEAVLSPTSAQAKVDVEILEQSFVPRATVKKAVHLEALARFFPQEKRTEVEINETTLADGAGTLQAAMEIADDGSMTVRHAQGSLDAVRLMALVPEDLVPLKAERVQLDYRVDRLIVDRTPRLAEGGSLTVRGELKDVQARFGETRVASRGGKVNIETQPQPGGGTTWKATAPLDALTVTQRGTRISANQLEGAVEGFLGEKRDWNGTVKLSAAALDFVGAGKEATRLRAKRAQFEVDARGLQINETAILRSRGQATSVGRIASLGIERGAFQTTLDHAGWTAEAQMAESGRAKVNIGLGKVAALNASCVFDKDLSAVDFDVDANASTLDLLRPFLQKSNHPALSRMTARLISKGRVDRPLLASRNLRHRTTLHVDRPMFREPRFAADALDLALTSSGTMDAHEGEAELQVRELAVSDQPLHDGSLKAGFKLDGHAPSLSLKITTQGEAAPGGELTLVVGFDRSTRAMRYDVDAHFARLAAVGPLLSARGVSGFDLSELGLRLAAHGSVQGLIARVDKGVQWVADPLATVAAIGTLNLDVDGFRWERGDRRVAVPKGRWHLEHGVDGDRRWARGRLEASVVRIAFGDHEIHVAGVEDKLDLRMSDLHVGAGEVTHQLKLRALSQDFAPQYPVGDVELSTKATHDRHGVVHIAELKATNRLGGTTAELSGGLDVGGLRRRLTLKGELRQDLSRVWTAAHEFKGRGSATVSLRADSGNLRVFNLLGALRFSGADLNLPRAGVTVQSAEGEIPITADVVFDRRGLRFLRDTNVNAYSDLRFADQHPLLRRPSFISIARITTPLVSVAPLAGNLHISNNVAAINQLEMGLRGGNVTGQCTVDWSPEDTTVQLHVRASKVGASSNEPFDGNIAVVLSTRERSIQGRAEILRISRRHLLDLLDLQDPHRANPAMNRVRRALGLGYPDHVRLSFNHGFANARVTFGGLARLVTVDELRGIPVGPIVDKILAPLAKKEETP